MTPLEIALTCLGGYLAIGMVYARETFRRVRWQLNDDNFNAASSFGAGLIWPLALLAIGAVMLIKTPDRRQRRKIRHDRLEQKISDLERELGIAQDQARRFGYWRGA